MGQPDLSLACHAESELIRIILASEVGKNPVPVDNTGKYLPAFTHEFWVSSELYKHTFLWV